MSTEDREGVLREALTAGLADALTKDWPGDTRLSTAPAIVDYLLGRDDVRAALAAPDQSRVEGLAGVEAVRTKAAEMRAQTKRTAISAEDWRFLNGYELALRDLGVLPLYALTPPDPDTEPRA